jgi:hydroxyethylthiazole kinase
MAAHTSNPVKPDPLSLIERATQLLPRLRARAPKVHCITNTVAQPITANVLLAAGAIPSLTTSEEEIGAFARSADALLVNLGTLDAERRRAIAIALDQARDSKLPWLLDPVFVDRSALRLDFARKLLERGPLAIRLNGAEFEALAGQPPTAEAVKAFAGSRRTIVAMTGQIDLISDGVRLVTIANGDPLMGKVTAMGCAGSAFVTAGLVVDDDAFAAVAAALTVFGIAGELAAAISKGPGTLAFAIIDALHGMTPDMIADHARVADG